MDDILNKIYQCKKPLDVWLKAGPMTQHKIIKQIFLTENNQNTLFAKELLEYLNTNDCVHIKHSFVNLLCIVLARTHDSDYLETIVNTKCAINTDRYCNIDSGLLFEFSPNKTRETCIQDTLNFINNCKRSDEWFITYKNMVTHYSSFYKEDLVIKYWNKYKSDNFRKWIDCCIEDISYGLPYNSENIEMESLIIYLNQLIN